MEIDENMWRDLECPVCFETVNSTVHVCSNGHHVCNSCRPKLTTCPQCRSTFMNAKIQLLDYLMKFAYIQCSNTKYGCTSIVKIKDIPTHKKDCLYNSFKCPVNECGVNVRMKSLVGHFEQEHRDIAMHSLHNESSAVGNIEWTSRNILKDSLIILNFQIGYMSEKFVYQCKREKSNFLLFYVQYLVCGLFLLCFEYDIVFTVNGRKFSFTGPVKKMTETYKSITSSGDCLCVSLNESEVCIEDISIKITIRKQ